MSQLGKGQDESLVVFPEVGETFTADDGTVSVVLADTMDANYEPTREELEVFAEWMGMKLPEDNEFLYIAREGLKAPLPEDWRPCRTNDNEIYYFNFRTGESRWNHPMDEFFREKFLDEKKKKMASRTSSNETKKETRFTSLHYSDTSFTRGKVPGEKCSGASSSSIGNQNNTACIMKKPLVSNVVGKAAGENAFVPNLGTAVPVLSNAFTSFNEKAPVDVLKQAAIKKTMPQGAGEPRIVSEAEKNLENKIREEREAAFREEEEKAERAHETTLQEMRRANDVEVQKVREELTARLAGVQSRLRKEQEERTAKRRGELEEKLRARVDEVLQEEKAFQQQLAQLREQHAQRVSSEVAKVEDATKKQHERELGRKDMELAVSLEKLKSEANAEFMVKKAELQKKFQEEEQQLKQTEQMRHQAELAALQQKRRMNRANSCEGSEGAAGGDVMGNVAAIFQEEKEKEEREIAAIVRAGIEEQAALRTTLEATLSQLREEIGDIERASTTLLATLDSKALDECLAEVRYRWRVEEQKYMDAVAQERQKMLAAVERQLSSAQLTHSFPFSLVAAGPDGNCCKKPRVASDAVLASRKEALQETEAFLRDTLQKELANTSAPTDFQIAEAIKGDLSVFVRSLEAQRRFEQNEFEWRHEKMLAERDKSMMTQTTETVGLAASVEEELQGVVAVEVEKALKAMATDNEVALRRLHQRYQEERCSLFMAVDKEMLAYEENARGAIDVEEEAKAKQKEAEMRALAEMEHSRKKKMEKEMNIKANVQPQQRSQGVPIEWLQQRLNSIELIYMAQEQRLKAELDSINMEIKKLKEPLIAGEEEKLLQQGSFKPMPQPKNIDGSSPGVLSAVGLLSCQRERRSASPLLSEALRFLSEQQRELNARRGALDAAREEWQNDVRNANSRVSPGPILAKAAPGSAAGGSDVGSRLLTLVGSLGDCFQELSGRFAELRATSASPSAQRLGERRWRRSRSGRRNGHRRRADSMTGKRSSAIKKTTGKLSQGIRTERFSAGCMEKWGKILLDLASPCSQNCSEVNEFIQNQLTC